MSIKQAGRLRKQAQISDSEAAWRDNSAENTAAAPSPIAEPRPRKAAPKTKPAAATKEARVSFSVDPSLRKKAKILFSLNEETFAGYLEGCLERYVQKHRNLLPDSLK